MISEPTFLFNKSVFIFPLEGDKITFSNDNLVIKDVDEKIKFQYTCYKIFIIFIIGGFSLTSGLIEKSRKFGFSIVFLTTSYKVYGTINYKTEGNFILREKQYNCTKKNHIANMIVRNKINNQIMFIQKLRRKEYSERIELLRKSLNKLENFDLPINDIMGIEGCCAKVYFNTIYSDIDWVGRQPRLKRDIINLLLDVGYTILFNYIEAMLNIYGFDLYKANLHQEFYKRKSLVCDIIEPFRCIVDYKILKMYNLAQIKESDFIKINDKFNIKYNNKEIVNQLFSEINNYKICIFRYIQSYYRWFMKSQTIDKMPKAKVEKNDIN